MYARILVPLDGSTFAESALPLALEVGRRDGATLDLVTVHEPVPSFAYDEWERAAREWSEQYLADVRQRLGDEHGVVLKSTVLSGRVAEALEQRARDTDADLVVMATHGRGAFTRAWLGSVADALVRHAPCPVLLVRPERDERFEITGTRTVRSVLVALDGSELSEQMLPAAVALGEAFDAAYLLGRVVAYPVEIASPYLPHTVQMNQEIVEDAVKAAQGYLEDRAHPLRERGLRADTAVLVDAQAGHGILRLAEENEVDIIAMATHGRGGFSRAVLGSAADKVVRGAHRPVLVYRPVKTS